MKNTITLFFCMLSSVWSYSQSISLDPNSPTEGRRNEVTGFFIVGEGTHFTQSSSFIVSLKSTVDGSVFSSANFTASENTKCSGAFVIPATATPGVYTLSIYTTNEGKLNLPFAFTVTHQSPKPQIIDFSPKIVTQGQQEKMTIVARYAKFKKSSKIGVWLHNYNSVIKGMQGNGVVVLNDSTISVNFNIPAYRRSAECILSVATDSDYLYSDNSRFCMINGANPQVLSVSPNAATDSSHVDMTIRCTQTRFTSEPYLNVSFPGAPIYTIATTVVDDSTLNVSCDIPLHAPSGVGDLWIQGAIHGIIEYAGALTVTERYPLPKPSITDISPYFVKRGTRSHIVVTGKNLQLSDTSIIRTDGFMGPFHTIIPPDSLEILNDSQFSFIVHIPFETPMELYSLELYIDNVLFRLYDIFTVVEDEYPNPKLVSVSPNSAFRGQTLDLVITAIGTHYTRIPAPHVFLSAMNNSHAAVSSTALNDTMLLCRFELPKYARRDVYDLVVQDASRGILLVNGFNIVSDTSDPRLVSVTPAVTSPGQTFDVVITGYNTHFMQLTDPLTLSIFSPAEDIQFTHSRRVNDTTIEARFEIPFNFPLGQYDVGVVSGAYGFMGLPMSVTVRETSGLSSGVPQVSNLYPNPVHDYLFVETKSSVRSCTIIDITGKQTIVDSNEFKQDNTRINISVDKFGLHTGIYFLRLETENGFDYQKFIVE